ncbi:MAG: hypothetical protein V1879_01330 [Pseudomonadota bacterium]
MQTLTAESAEKTFYSISTLLLTQGFEATLNFFCTLFVFSVD